MVTTKHMTQKKACLLMVTQDADVKKLVETLIEHRRVQGDFTTSVQAAARFLQNNPLPDVVILDLSLPDDTALAFLEQLRNRDEFKKLPVLVLTDFPDPDQVRDALGKGASRYLTKLFINRNLLSTLDEMVI